ncbi:MAG: carbon-nitrogen hydrolase family protein [Chloroflexota bacterium]|nr:carbon-nitrogen hydrolase family protein [Chloroflexota bacterium]
MVRVAVAQFDPHLADRASNLARIEQLIEAAASQSAALVVFPECAMTGYVFNSLDEALAEAESVPGEASDRIAAACAKHRIHAVAGMLERVEDRCYNAALLVGPHGIESVYRKTHILCLGVDRFTTPGEGPYRVITLPFGRVGVLICYDLRFPEPARALALAGAQAILLPTNWPQSSSIQADVFTRSRAAENRVFVLAADRVGRERGATFLGRSQIVNPAGDVLREASRSDTEMLIADIDLGEADHKHVIVRAGEHEMDCFTDRHPELYGILAGTPVGAGGR